MFVFVRGSRAVFTYWEVWYNIGGLHRDRDSVLGIVVALFLSVLQKNISYLFSEKKNIQFTWEPNIRYKWNSVRHWDLVYEKALSPKHKPQ